MSELKGKILLKFDDNTNDLVDFVVGAEDGAGAFRVMLHGSAWTAGDLQTALQALGATVGANNYDASGATATGFTY